MNDPHVSIIIATFNAAKLLPRTIESISNLSYNSIECIVIDGASNDGTVDLLQQNEDTINRWLSEPDAGIYDAWNKGVSLARGDWIAFLGAGDCYKPDAVTNYIEAIKKSSIEPNFISSRVEFVNNHGTVVRVKGAPFEWMAFKKYMPIAHVGAFHHKTLFEKYGLFETTFASAADYEFLMRCGPNLNAMYLDIVTAEMLVGGASDSYAGLKETYRIQRKYGFNLFLSRFRLWVAYVKRYVRPFLRRY